MIGSTSFKKHIYIILPALVLILTGMSDFVTAFCKEKNLSRNARMALVKAQEHMKKKQTNKALKVLLDFTQKSPRENHVFVESTLAGLLYDQNQQTAALEHYQKSVDICPAYGPGWQNLGKICFDHKKFARAAHAMEKAYELDKQKNPRLRFHAAVAHMHAGAPQKAFEHMQFLTSKKTVPPDINQLKILANLALELKCPGKAIGTIEKCINQPKPGPISPDPTNLDPKNINPILYRLVATLYLEQKNYRQAAEALVVYTMLHPPTIEEEILLGDLYNRIGIPYKAAQLYEKVMEKRPGTSLCKRLVSSWMEACCPDKALETVEKGLQKYPQCHFLWKMKGWLCYETQSFKTASMAFSKAHGLKCKDQKSLFMMGLCAIKAEQADVAQKALKTFDLNKD